MTEREWLATTDSVRMLQFLGRPTRERKMALFSAACCRRLGGLLIDLRTVQALIPLSSLPTVTPQGRSWRRQRARQQRR